MPRSGLVCQAVVTRPQWALSVSNNNCETVIGQDSTVEMMHRLKNATLDQMKATSRLTRWITFLTWALVFLAIVQVSFIIEVYVSRF